MKRNLLIASTGLIMLALVVFASLVFRHRQIPASPVPPDWRLVNLNDFSFSIPPNMKDLGGKGTDLGVWRYGRRDISIEVQYGPSATPPEYFSDQPEYAEEHLNTDGTEGKLVTFRLDDSKVGVFSNGSLRYVAAARLAKEGNGVGAPVTVWITYLDKSEQELVKKVLRSVRFKSAG